MIEKLNTLGIAHAFLREHVKSGDFCIDATAGRGYDTAFLAELVGETGKVLAFDIQDSAIESTNALLESRGLRRRVTTILDSHSNMASYAEEETVDAIVFNLGYLPGGDHSICTHAESSIAAIEQSLKLLRPKGVICLCIYYGGDSGYDEKNALMDYLKTIDHKKYTVLLTDFYNRPNDPPMAVFLYKQT